MKPLICVVKSKVVAKQQKPGWTLVDNCRASKPLLQLCGIRLIATVVTIMTPPHYRGFDFRWVVVIGWIIIPQM